MKKDIDIPEVKDVYIAAIPEGKADSRSWYIHVINDLPEMIEAVMITSKGYTIEGNLQKTVSSTLRHRIGSIPYKSAVKVEMIDQQVFEIYNEYWVTFFLNGKLMEKKFTFGPHTIDAEFLEDIPVHASKGILVK
jgi:hypothetical protein